jgi:[ribosomal protein S18]-alanine N-acetyltransferase
MTGPAELAIVPMRWWHLADVMQAERELFGAESWSEASFWSELAQPDTRYYVVAEDAAQPAADRFVGYAGLAVIGDEAHVLTLGVRADQQRRGVGAALLRDLLAEATSRGAGTVLLDVRADNPAAQRLYSRHGFVPAGIRKRYYQPSGTDAVVMVRHG